MIDMFLDNLIATNEQRFGMRGYGLGVRKWEPGNEIRNGSCFRN